MPCLVNTMLVSCTSNSTEEENNSQLDMMPAANFKLYSIKQYSIVVNPFGHATMIFYLVYILYILVVGR